MVLHHLVSFTLFFCYVEPPSIPKHGVWSETFGHRHTVHSTMQHNTSSIQIKTGVTQEAASGRDSVRCLSKARGHPDGGFGRRRETGRGQRGRAWERMGVVQRCRTPLRLKRTALGRPPLRPRLRGGRGSLQAQGMATAAAKAPKFRSSISCQPSPSLSGVSSNLASKETHPPPTLFFHLVFQSHQIK